MTAISNIHIDSGFVTATVNGQKQKIDPSYLLMQVLANKRRNLTSQYISFIGDMNQVNQRAERLEEFRSQMSAKATSMKKDAKAGYYDVVGPHDTIGLTDADFKVSPYVHDGHFSKESLQDMVEAIRNKIQTLNNLNSQTQVKIKMIDEYRNETIEWQNSLQDRLERVFSKINQ